MLDRFVLCAAISVLVFAGISECKTKPEASEEVLFNFTSSGTDVDSWVEVSDTARPVGMSKAAAAIFENSQSRRAVFFALLNLQPDGSGFAGMTKNVHFDLKKFSGFQVYCRGQGEYKGWKIVLQHKNQDNSLPTYESFFTTPSTDFASVSVPFDSFHAYFRGRLLNSSEPLDTSAITNFQLQTYGGVFQGVRQTGPLTLEVDWVKAVV